MTESTTSFLFNGPYITHKPDIKVFDLSQDDRFLIMGSDGLWDEVTKDDIATIVSEHPTDKQQIVASLFHLILSRTAQKHNMTISELADLPLGDRRNYHDDITITIVDLK